MATKEEVEKFLDEFYQKVKVFGLVFRQDRDKNTKTLAILDITTSFRTEVVMSLCAEDYISGPNKDTLNNISDLWVFGKDVKNHEVYIKITVGRFNSSAICISFHVAERKLKYIFK